MADLEEATDAQLPYGLGSVDVTNPVALAVLVTSLVLGMTLWHVAEDWGNTLASRLSTAFASLTGYNPSTGDSSDNTAPVGGS